MGLSSFRLPKCRLADIPGIALPPLPEGLTLPEGFDIKNLELPSFRLGSIKSLDLPGLSLQLRAGTLRLPQLRLPALRLSADFLLPDIELQLRLQWKFGAAQWKGGSLLDFELTWSGLAKWLLEVDLPSFELESFPGLRVPEWPMLPNIDLNMSKVSMPNVNAPNVNMPNVNMPNINMSNVNMPNVNMPNVNMPNVNMPNVNLNRPNINLPNIDPLQFHVPSIHLEHPLGGLVMKFKLLLGFGQVLSYFAVTFSSIPWGPRFISLFKFFELFSFDIFSFFGATSCQFQTGFLEKFAFHMALIPILVGLLYAAYLVAACRVRKPMPSKNKKGTKFTRESAKSVFFKLTSLILYTVYVGVSTRIFRLFKCREIQGIWYLTSDYTVKCFQDDWNNTSAIAYVCMAVFVVGIPLGQFLVLHHNRMYIDEAACLDSVVAHRRHVRVKQQYGSLFKDYNVECYYYDLIDLGRRLVLTGGLIMVGGDENAVAQVFLGILVSVMWLCLVLQKRPYKSQWDTALSAMLSFVLVLTLVTGVCLRLFELTFDAADVYQREACVFFNFFPAVVVSYYMMSVSVVTFFVLIFFLTEMFLVFFSLSSSCVSYAAAVLPL